MVNVGEQPVPMNVFLSYGKRDMLLNQRHTTTTDDAPKGLGASLSLWVMKSTVPVRRYVGGALPLVHAGAHLDAPIHFPTGTWACSPPMWRSMSRTRS